jgi:hypothetical protein
MLYQLSYASGGARALSLALSRSEGASEDARDPQAYRFRSGSPTCANTPGWIDSSHKRQWWLIGVAALLASIFLGGAFGSWAAVGLIAADIAAWQSISGRAARRPAPSAA